MSAYSDLILSHGSLRAYYRLGEASGTTLSDSGPNALNGTYGPSMTYGASGALANDTDTAVTFPGNQNASVADNNALDLGDGPLTLECWARRSATQDAPQVLVTKNATSGYRLNFTAANAVALAREGGTPVATSSVTITDTTTWHHLVVTKNGSARKVYVDGVDVTVLGTNATLTDNTASLLIGPTFPGSLDEIAIYGAVLSPAEVLDHYEVGSGIIKLDASAAGSSTAVGDLTIGRPLEGTSAGAGSATADLDVVLGLAGASAGTSTATATLTGAWALAGSANGSSTATGMLTLAGESTPPFANASLGRASLGRAVLGRSEPGFGRRSIKRG